jgi:lysophospholipase L1-like esterase
MLTRLRQICLLALVLAASGCASQQTAVVEQAAVVQTKPSSSSFEKEIAAFEASDRTDPPPQNAILFIGSSSIRMWKSLAADFPDRKVINRGFGGSQIIDSAHYADRIVIPYHPKLIVFYAGGNDINAGKSAEQVFDEFKIFVARVRAALPEARIDYISSAPNPRRWEQVERVKKLNGLIADYCRMHRGMVFINVFPHMLGPDGQPKPDIFLDDRLHMNAKGYAIWREIVGPYLKK